MNKNLLVSSISTIILLSGFSAGVNAQVIEIMCAADEGCGMSDGTTNDGTIFEANANPTSPATGTGVFEPFVRIQDSSGTESGYNTDTGNPDINFDTKAGKWTHSVSFGDLATFERDDGNSYYLLQLDANESGRADSIENLIDITDIQIFIGGSELATPELYGGYTGTLFDNYGDGDWGNNQLAGLDAVWTLDSAINGDVKVILQASICDAKGQCGSGHGDLDMYILASELGDHADDDYFVFYSEYDRVDSGFEEWRYNASVAVSVPEPSTLPLMFAGLAGMIFVNRRGRKKKV